MEYIENILYNELVIQECAIDVGVVYSNEKNSKGKINKVAREIDFIAISGGKKTYIHSPKSLSATIFASVGMMIMVYCDG